MKKILFATFLTLSTSAFSQIQPSTTYDGGDLYFVPAKLTSNGIPFYIVTETIMNRVKHGSPSLTTK